jgi:hypothetical protein
MATILRATSAAPQVSALSAYRPPPQRGTYVRGKQRYQLLGALAFDQRLSGYAFADALAAVAQANRQGCEPALASAAVSRIARFAYANTTRALIAIDIWIFSGWVAPVSSDRETN